MREFIEFNYDIIHLKNKSWLFDYGKEEFDSGYLKFINRKREVDLNDANLIFSDVIDDSVKSKFCSQFYNEILTSEMGRGNMFRKFYNYIFSDDTKTRSFFDKKDFLNVPHKTINYANLVCCMILNFSELEFYLDKEIISVLRSFLEAEDTDNNKYLLDLLYFHERGLRNDFR